MLKRGAQFLASQTKQHAATRVTYTRGSEELEVYAGVGKTELDAVSGDGHTLYMQTRDYIFDREDLQPLSPGEMFKPIAGDQIIEEMPEGDDAVYEPAPMPDGQSWRWVDASRLIIRIHTKRVR